MRKQIMFGLLALLSASGAKAQYGFAAPVGSATTTAGTPATINLTTSPGYSTGNDGGAIWNYNTVDFNRSFSIEYDLAVRRVYGSGADGICAVFKQNPSLTSIGNPAGYLGYYGGADFASNSFAIEFDDFDNGTTVNDPSPYTDHMMIVKNGDFNSPNVISPAVSILPSGATIQDNVLRHYRIEWVCSTNTLNVYVGGVRRITTDSVDYRTLFTNPGAVTWGFTGGLGSSGSNHIVSNVTVSSGEICAQPCRYEPSVRPTTTNGLTQLYINPNNSSSVLIAGYTWDFGDGSAPLTTTSPGVQHSYSAPGTYNVTVTILGYNTTTGECCSFRYPIRIDVPRERSLQRSSAPLRTAGTDPDLEVYPNPSNGKVGVNLPGVQFSKIAVYDISGRKASEFSFEPTSSKQLDLRSLEKGIYILQLTDEHGQLRTQKVNLRD